MIIIYLIITNISKRYLISNDNYPHLNQVFMARSQIKKELSNVMQTKLWTNWMDYDKMNETPVFTKMTPEKILNHMNTHNTELNNGKPSWKIFGLILAGKIIKQNQILCPTTVKLLSKIPNIINAGFSCLEPNVSTSMHKGYNDDIYRCHIPLVIPDGDCGIVIDGNIIRWKTNDYFIFDDTYYHKAWNYTKENRFVLIIDIKK